MVMKPEPLAAAVRSARDQWPSAATVLMTPQGRVFDQPLARDLAASDGLILVCGRYEGVDERVCTDHIDLEISIGDYVLTGGELPAMVVIDAIARRLPEALGSDESARYESFSPELDGRKEYPQYTKPREFNGWKVPDVLLSGDHGKIEEWRHEESIKRTKQRRPGMLDE